MTDSLQKFTPDWISPPGETITDLLEDLGWSQVEFAGRLGCAETQVALMINGEAVIDEELAVRLAEVLGGTNIFWLRREAQYRSKLAQQEFEYKSDHNIDSKRTVGITTE